MRRFLPYRTYLAYLTYLTLLAYLTYLTHLGRETKRLLLDQLYRSLTNPFGILILGTAEQAGAGGHNLFKPVRHCPHIYQPVALPDRELDRPVRWEALSASTSELSSVFRNSAPRPSDKLDFSGSEASEKSLQLRPATVQLSCECTQLLRMMLHGGVGIVVDAGLVVISLLIPPDVTAETKEVLVDMPATSDAGGETLRGLYPRLHSILQTSLHVSACLLHSPHAFIPHFAHRRVRVPACFVAHSPLTAVTSEPT